MDRSAYKGKAVIFLADGMADEPLAELGNRTPLEAVDTPWMDRIAKRGASGTFLSLPDGFPTSSDAANMSVLGYSLAQFYPGRGPIEATAQGIELGKDDIAWRCNLIYEKDGILKDYSAGHVPNEVSSGLMKALQERFGNDKVSFYPGVSYRNLLVLHGKEFSANIDYAKPDSSQDEPVSELGLKALDNTPEAAHTVAFLNKIMAESAPFLEGHPLNRGREVPANRIWPWSPGRRPSFPSFSEKYGGKTGAVISAVDVIFGIARCAGMDMIRVPGATGFIDTNYEGKAQAALKALEDHDLVYLHVEAIDECSHLGDLKLKMRAISEFENRIVAPVMSALEGCGVTFAILPDHPVPLHQRKHTRTPVPVAICGDHIVPDSVCVYSETEAPKGSLGQMKGDEFIRKVLNLK
ncbi:MAG: cofactor-independent phosphoglycerate mutase [Lentisphaerae bacterium ADurb.Bin242]|nr:MAG: cofactor-independent phosphoglycerate mutase [Lentisphaerae bacterium ADurb.Bin242]